MLSSAILFKNNKNIIVVIRFSLFLCLQNRGILLILVDNRFDFILSVLKTLLKDLL